MPGELNHFPVNWVDGMKISRKHFEETGLYVEEQIKQANSIHLTDINFGILPGNKSLDLEVFCDVNQQITIELKSCNAVTPTGSRIFISPGDTVKHSVNFKEIATTFNLQASQPQNIYIILSINIFRRIPAGEPNMEENPPRHPYTIPELRLNLLPAESVNTNKLADSLVIGKINYQNGELIVQKDFIPACTAMNSVPSLTEWYNKFRQVLDGWEQSCIRIIQKINSKTQLQQPNALASSIQKLSEKMLEQLVEQKIHYQWILSKSAPIHFCAALLNNIQYLYTIQQCYPEKDREEMLNYFAEWTDSQTGALDNQTLRVLQLSYNHSDTASLMNEIYQGYLAYLQIFQKLAQLEFIGKKKGQNIFVIEQEVKDNKPASQTPGQKPNSRWSPLT
jgi:hypothetical protein